MRDREPGEAGDVEGTQEGQTGATPGRESGGDAGALGPRSDPDTFWGGSYRAFRLLSPLWLRTSVLLQARSDAGTGRTAAGPGAGPRVPAGAGTGAGAGGRAQAGVEAGAGAEAAGRVGRRLGAGAGTGPRARGHLRPGRARALAALRSAASSSSTSSRRLMKPGRALPGPWAPGAAAGS